MDSESLLIEVIPFVNNLMPLILAYLLGCIPVAVIVCKGFGLPDPKSSGSNNPGATNVLRIGGKLPGLLSFLGDALKAAPAVYIAAKYYGFSQYALGWVVLAGVLGHVYPITQKFVGGKGIATTIGCLFVQHHIFAATFLAVWALGFVATKISSVGALSATLSLLFISLWQFGFTMAALPFVILSGLLLFTHRSNIQRLLKAEESKITKA